MENQLTKIEVVALEYAKILTREQISNCTHGALTEFVRNKDCYAKDRAITERSLRFAVNFLKTVNEYSSNG